MKAQPAPTTALGPVPDAAWPELSRLLDEALALAAADRDAWLQALPATPAKATLERLLAQQAWVESRHFLEALPALTLPPAGDGLPALPQAGAEVGPWRLLRELGQGGMGAVWLAERADGSLKRPVALKLPNSSWNRALAERLQRERDILAALTHPHIARLYDAGIDRAGRPYLALEYVDGLPIDVHVREQGLGVRGILGLLLQVAAAVAHAHGRLVIHRDLKPANILVDRSGQVRLLDFGIAKLLQGEQTAETALTRAAGHALTPEYASPEQIRGEPLGTASDVYAMAVVAYELLAGRRPYALRRGSLAELEEAIAGADPPRASDMAADPARRKALRGDLDAILQQGLRKRPEDRYATADAWADDLQRHLDGHAVRARPDSRWYVARKFLARHRLPVLAAVAAVGALGVGLAVALWQADTARRHLHLANQALEREDGVRRLLVESLSALSAMDPKAFAEPGSVSRLLQAKHDELARLFHDKPDQQLALLNTVATQLPYFGDFEGSLAAWQRYLPLAKARRLGGTQRLEGYIGAARALYFLGRWGDLEALAQEGLAATAGQQGLAGPRAELAYQLVHALLRRGARDEARRLIDSHAQAVQASEHPRHKVRWDLLMALARMDLEHDAPAALQRAQQARAGYEADSDASVSQRGMSALLVGQAQGLLGDAPAAEAALADGLRLYETIFSREDRDTVLALSRLAAAQAAQGRYDAARELLQARRQVVTARPGPDTALALRTLLAREFEVAVLHGDLAGAAALAPTVAQAYAEARDPRDRALVVLLDAQRLALAGQHEPAARRLSDWLAQLTPAQQGEPAAWRARLALAQIDLDRSRPAEAAAQAEAVRTDLQRAGATRSWLHRVALEVQAAAQARQGQGEQARQRLRALDADADLAAIAPPSLADRAASLRWRLAVAQANAADLTTAREQLHQALQGQHPASPRWAWQPAGP